MNHPFKRNNYTSVLTNNLYYQIWYKAIIYL